MSDENKNKQNQKVKNLISLVILLSGLFVGSLFVDLSQLIKGGGISQKVINDKDIFELNGRTWVAYSEPIVKMSVINDDACEDCKVDEVLVWFKKMLPTVQTEKVAYDSSEGKKLIDEYKIKTLPAFVFGGEIKDTNFYTQAAQFFTEKDSRYVLDTMKLGMPAGKYLQTPEITDNDIKIGPDDAKVKIIEFSDFQCPYCKMFQETVDKILSEYGNDVQLVFKNLPLESIHPRARAAALAGECANEQGKFLDYSKKLFDNQKTWTKTDNNRYFINYATQLGLNTKQFEKCLKDEKYNDKIDESLALAKEFGISGTPALFINDKFKGGVSKLEDLNAIIDDYLGKTNEDNGNKNEESKTSNDNGETRDNNTANNEENK